MQAGLYCLLIWRDNLKDKISNKENNEAIEVSLLDGPDVETQVREKPFKIAARIVAILVLFILLIASYVLKFSVDLYPDSVDKFYISSFKTESFYQTKSCDLIVVRPYENVKDAKVGDIIFYSSNIEKGSAKLVAFDVSNPLTSNVLTFSQPLNISSNVYTLDVLNLLTSISFMFIQSSDSLSHVSYDLINSVNVIPLAFRVTTLSAMSLNKKSI